MVRPAGEDSGAGSGFGVLQLIAAERGQLALIGGQNVGPDEISGRAQPRHAPGARDRDIVGQDALDHALAFVGVGKEELLRARGPLVEAIAVRQHGIAAPQRLDQ